MTERDPKCVHVDSDFATAQFIATWLGSQGIPAVVMNEEALGGFEGLAGVAENLGYRGTEVWVDRLADADRARLLFKENEARLRAERAAALGPVEVVCEACGHRSMFPAAARGLVQECPKCSEYVDVPGSADNFDDAEIEAAVDGE